jgi:MFS family permease
MTRTGTPARAGYGPWVIPLLSAALFINYVDRGNLATAAPLLKDELGLDAAHLGLLFSAFAWTYVAAMPLAGWMTDRLGVYRTMALGLGLWSAATLLTGLAHGFAAIFALRLLLGLGESVALPCASTFVSRHVAHDRLGAANGLLAQGLSLGPAFGVLAGGLLMAQLGWRGLFLLFGAVSLAWLAPWLLATRSLRRSEAAEPVTAPAPAFREILARRELWGATIGHLTSNYAFYFVISWLPLYLVKARGFSLPQMAGIGAAVYLVYAAAAALSGWATDRWIAAGASQGQARKTTATAAHVVAAAGLLVTAWGGPAWSLAGLGIAAVGLGAVNPHVFATAQILSGSRATAKWLGVQNCIGNLSGIVGPLVTGAIIDSPAGFKGAFVVTAGVAVAGLVGWLGLIPRLETLSWSSASRPDAARA